MTVGEALVAGRERLRAHGEAGRFDAARLLEDVLGRRAAWMLAHGDEELADAVRARYDAAVARRAAGEPVAYIVGSAGFYARRFGVTRDVLVPRPESEALVDLACAYARARGLPTPRFWDVGTGSGILAITLACELPQASVTATDISAAALDVARRNAREHGVEDRIRFVEGDALQGETPGGPFDCVVANLPYVRTGSLQPPPDPTSFEPALALDGGDDGLAVYRRLFAAVPPLLVEANALLLEAGPDTARALAALAATTFGAAADVRVHRDFGGHERIVDVRRTGRRRTP